MVVLFQVAAMEGEPEQQPQLVTFDEAAIAAQELGGRESVKNSFQCNECFKASGCSGRQNNTGKFRTLFDISKQILQLQMFKNRRQLSAHEAAVHLKEKPFGCELCPYRASRKQHIKVRFNMADGLSESVLEKCIKSTTDVCSTGWSLSLALP